MKYLHPKRMGFKESLKADQPLKINVYYRCRFLFCVIDIVLHKSLKKLPKKNFLFFLFCSKRMATKVKTKSWRSSFFSTFFFVCKNNPQGTTCLFFFSLFVFVEVFSNFFFSLVSKKKQGKLARLFFVPFKTNSFSPLP